MQQTGDRSVHLDGIAQMIVGDQRTVSPSNETQPAIDAIVHSHQLSSTSPVN